MTELLHMKDNYIREFTARVVELTDEGVVLDRTAFYPLKGGVNCDTGVLLAGGREHRVTGTYLRGGKVVHITDTEGLEEGMEVSGKLDWERRYRLMRNHTAAHLLEAVLFRKAGALIGGGSVDAEKSRIDFTLEKMDRELIEDAVREANELVAGGAPVRIYFMPREDALRDPEMVKLAGKLPPEVRELRIVEIEGIDRQACGGPHVANISELGKIRVLKMENKGRGRRRLYYTVE